MAAAALDLRLQRYNELLGDPSRPISEIELNRIVRELREMAGRVDHEMAGYIFALMGLCYERLGRYEKALDEYKLALQRTPEPTPLRSDILGNRGVALVYLGKYQEGATSLIEA